MDQNQQNMNYEYNEDLFLQQNPYAHRQGFGIRLGAWFIDLVIMMIIMAFAFIFAGPMDFFMDGFEFTDFQDPEFMVEYMEAMRPFTLISLLFSLVYSLFEVFFAASIGKMILGLQIASQDRTKASMGTLFTRFSVKNINWYFSIIAFMTSIDVINNVGSLLWIVIVVGFFFVLAEKRQAFHDMIAKTAVYKRDDVLTENIGNQF
jgi:uncharacterized RDD family membrane protein YckC